MIDYGYGIALDTIDRVKDIARKWRNDSAVYRTCRQVGLLDEPHHQKWLERIANDPSISMFSLIPNGKGQGESIFGVGVCGFTSINHINQTAEYSLYIAKICQGYHYATPALQTLLRHGFEDLNLHCIYGEIFEGNEKSLHIAEKLGFTQDGYLPERYFKEGKRIGTFIVSLLRPNWKP